MSTKDVLDKAQRFISAVRDNSDESKWMYKFFERCTGKAKGKATKDLGLTSVISADWSEP
jgi:adenosine deaminase